MKHWHNMYLAHHYNNGSSLETFFSNASVGAFVGSFSAFIFGLIAYDYTKRRDKWTVHHTALVIAENLINRQLNGISNNIFLLKGSIETFEKEAFSENELYPLDNPPDFIDFLNIDLRNEYLDYQSLVEKVNHDLISWNRSNIRLFDAALSGRVSDESIDINRKGLLQRSKQIVEHLEDLMQEAYTTGAYIRKFIAVDQRDILARLFKTANISLTDEEVDEERKKYIKESEETMEKDREGRLKKYRDRK